MAGKKKRSVSFNTLVKMFIRDYSIPTKKDIDKLIDRIDRLETLIKNTTPGNTRSNTAKKKNSEGPQTASDIVMNVIKDYKEGIQFSDIHKKTGFEQKKLRNIIYRLNKTNKIITVSRGIYKINNDISA